MTKKDVVAQLKELYGMPQGEALRQVVDELLFHQRDVNIVGTTAEETLKAAYMREGAIVMGQAVKAILELPDRYGS